MPVIDLSKPADDPERIRDHLPGELPETLPLPIEDQLEAIAARRWEAIVAPLDFEGHTLTLLDGETLSRLDARIATMWVLPSSSTRSWEASRGVWIDLTVGQFQSLRHSFQARIDAAYDVSRPMMDAAQAGEPYDIDIGWP